MLQLKMIHIFIAMVTVLQYSSEAILSRIFETATNPTDQPVAMAWKHRYYDYYLCLGPESTIHEKGKRLDTRLSNCCYYPKLKWLSDGKIKSATDDICLRKTDKGTDVKFTDQLEDCAEFGKTANGLVKRKDVIDLYLMRKDDKHTYETFSTTNALNEYLTIINCSAPIRDQNHGLELTFVQDSIKYCWYPDNSDFSSNTDLENSHDVDCCKTHTFLTKSNGSWWLKTNNNNKVFCLTIEGMPGHKSFNDLDGKKAKINSDCKGSSFIYDESVGTLRVSGTNKCLLKDNQNILVNTCPSSNTLAPFRTAKCPVSSILISSLVSTTLSSSAPVTSSFASSSMTTVSSSVSSSVSKMTSSISSSMILVTTSTSSRFMAPSSTLFLATAMSSVAPSTTVITSSMITITSSPVSMTQKPLLSSSLSKHSSLSTLPTTSMLRNAASSLVTKLSTVLLLESSVAMSSTATISVAEASPGTLTTSSAVFTTVTEKLPFVELFAGEPVNGQWSFWSEWSECSVNCGTGQMERFRSCDNPFPRNGGSQCVGLPVDKKVCEKPMCSGKSLANAGENCEAHCESLGLVCSSSIQTGNSNQDFFHAGVNCSSDDSAKLYSKPYEPAFDAESSRCIGYVSVSSLKKCNASAPSQIRSLCNCITKDDKGFDEWAPWSECSLTCGGGARRRNRMCSSLQPKPDECIGNYTEVSQCNVHKCPINGGFAEWSSWSICSKSCDGGSRKRNRTCSNPYPQYNGDVCYGYYQETEQCGVGFCPVHGGWTSWTEWQHCNKPCNSGQNKRQRWCTDPIPKYNGRDCHGANNQSVPCNTNLCPNTSITVSNVAFIDTWKPSLNDASGLAFYNYSEKINSNVKQLFFPKMMSTYQRCWLHHLRSGSVVASFTLFFNSLDSFQSLYVIDAINVDHFLGKLPIVISSTANFTSNSVPSSPPANVTAMSLSAESLLVSWDEVPFADRNGLITGYILFHREASNVIYTSQGSSNTSMSILGLKPATRYVIRVLAYNSNGNGIASDPLNIYTQESAPSQPPNGVSTATLSSRVIEMEWTHPPVSSWNGLLTGYKITVFESKLIVKQIKVDQKTSSTMIDGLKPSTLYVIDICPFTSAGLGPCFRTFNKTEPSAPSVAPANVVCLNRTSFDKIKISFDPVPLEYIHGYLIGYRIEYRIHNSEAKFDSTAESKSVLVSPLKNTFTLKLLASNSIYAIQVMAVNEHGDGVKSPLSYAETCPCQEKLYTNYASIAPYIYRDIKGDMQGIFKMILQNITEHICGVCNGRRSVIDYVSDGKNGWADKGTLIQVTRGIDDYAQLSFAISGRKNLPAILGRPFVPTVDHPGMILFTSEKTASEQVDVMLSQLWNLWPILIINCIFICLAGIIYGLLTIERTSESCIFPSTAFRGIYWAYVTVFTHGYGDITPSTIISRLFTVIWVMIGLVNSAILIGAISTALTTASVLSDAKIYGSQLAVLEGSKEEVVGIYRNAKINPKKSIDDVYLALKHGDVKAALVDSFIAANRPDLFSDANILARKLIQYPYSYGFVLSGSMQNVAAKFQNFLLDNSYNIANMVEKTTPKFKVNSVPAAPVSIFDPSSPVLKQNLLILAIILLLLFFFGFLYWLWKRRASKINVAKQGTESQYLEACEQVCQSFFQDVENLANTIDAESEKNAERLLKLIYLKRRYPHKQILVKIQHETVDSSSESSYIEHEHSTTHGIVLTNHMAGKVTAPVSMG